LNEIGKLCRQYALKFVVDGAQSAGTHKINITENNIDALCCPGHKGLYGPQGTGFVVFSDKYAEGEIISQSPSANLRRVYRGEDIALRVTVSLGKERLYMPDLVGFDCYEAACVLRELGAVVRFASVYSEGGEHDKVLRTSIKADEEIEQGSRITLFVSRPRRHGSVKVKDYCRLPLSVATQRMMRDGLVLGEVIYAPSDDTADNFVIKQSLFVDSYVKWGSKIDITVADGSCEEVEIETNGEEF
jgi:beta-lactam-binding protein with PASTA domain